MGTWDIPAECQRQSGESARAHACFLQYCEHGEERSLAKVGREVGRSTQLLERWSSRYDWVARTKVWDAWTQAHRAEKVIAEQEAMVARHASFGQKAIEVAMDQLDRLRTRKLSAAATARLAKVGATIEMAARGKPPEDEQFASVTIRIYEKQPDGDEI